MTSTMTITDRMHHLIHQRWELVTKEVWFSKEGFVHSLLLLALSNEDIVRQAAYLSQYYFEGKGPTSLEDKERA